MCGHGWRAGVSQSCLQRREWHWQAWIQHPSAARASKGNYHSLSLMRNQFLSLNCDRCFMHGFPTRSACLASGGAMWVFFQSLFLIPWRRSSSRIAFQKTGDLERVSRFFQLGSFSYLLYYSVEAASNPAASFSFLTPILTADSNLQHLSDLCVLSGCKLLSSSVPFWVNLPSFVS